MDPALRQLVRDRAGNRCEYCLIHQDDDPFYRFHVEHIVSRQHGGTDDDQNLCWSCHHCNSHKGTNLTTIDEVGQQPVRLFNPRIDQWHEHFVLYDTEVVGITNIGRATLKLLQMNAPRRKNLRRERIE